MITQRFDGDTIAGAPKGWDQELDGPVNGLPIVADVDLHSGLTFLYSVWKPTDDEIALLLAGGGIRLGIAMPQHPIVNLMILKPEAMRDAGCSDFLDMG